MHNNQQDPADHILLLKAEEVARRLQVARATVYAMVAAGDLPTVRIGRGRAIRVPADALENWIKRQSDGAVGHACGPTRATDLAS
jgi:excisionase family DNA binding protein